MQSITAALLQKRHALLESPTGTGQMPLPLPLYFTANCILYTTWNVLAYKALTFSTPLKSFHNAGLASS